MFRLGIDSRGLEMITFREVNVDDAEMILRWRTSSRVTKFMNSDVEYDLEAQRNWLLASYKKPHYYHWIIENDGKPIGLINLADYSLSDATTSWGFYIGEENSDGLGAFIPPYFYNFLFGELSIETINVEVFYNNKNVIELHLLHGYKFAPERDRVILKNDKKILLVNMTLNKEHWNFKKFSRNLATFPIARWQAKPCF